MSDAWRYAAEQGMGRWVMGHENGMGHMGHGSLGDDPSVF